MGLIYKITDLTNTKIYIGKTQKTVEQRFLEHTKELIRYTKCVENNLNFGYKSRLYPAMYEHGIKNFIFEVLYVLNSEEDLNEKEKYYIELFNSTNPDIGYNISSGGDGGALFTGHAQSDKCKHENSIRLKGKKQDPEFIKRRTIKNRIPVQNLNTGEIFSCVGEAALKYTGNWSSGKCIGKACLEKRKAFNYFWIKLNKGDKTGYSEEERNTLIKEWEELYVKRKKLGFEKRKNTIENKSEEEIQKINNKISQSLKGRQKSAETCKKLSQARKGKKHSSHTIKKLKNYYQDAPKEKLEERWLHISQSQKGKHVYENLQTKKHKMFNPNEVPEDWILVPHKGGAVKNSKKYINKITGEKKYFKLNENVDLNIWKKITKNDR